MITLLAASTAEQIQEFALGVGAVIATGVGLWKFKLTRTLILRLVKSTINTATDWFDRRIYDGCTVATKDLREQVLPPGMSITERAYRLEQRIEELDARILELREDLDRLVD